MNDCGYQKRRHEDLNAAFDDVREVLNEAHRALDAYERSHQKNMARIAELEAENAELKRKTQPISVHFSADTPSRELTDALNTAIETAVAEEREACAQIVDGAAGHPRTAALAFAADLIRERGEK